MAEACRSGEIPGARITCLITDRLCGALDRAKGLAIPAFTLEPKQFPNTDEWTNAMTERLRHCGVHVVCLAGFLRKIGPGMLAAYPSRILNIHPALLPRFGGPGMYGRRVHEAVINAGETQTGVTIHIVDKEYDHGPVLWQERISVASGETPQRLETKIHELEHRVYPKALAEYLNKLRQNGFPASV